jgi:protein-tyrosine kinase
MGKTFEALMKAEKEGQKRLLEMVEVETNPLSNLNKPVKWSNLSQAMEEYLKMKHNILRLDLGKKIKTLLFLSPAEGEGNSNVLKNFGITLASEGERVLIVDANLRNPVFHKVFDLEKENGLTELLLEQKTLMEVIKPTSLDNLFVVTCGSDCPSPSFAFESKSLDFHIGKMKGQADWVLFDSPPVNLFNDAIILASRVDGVVMVIQAEKTRWEVAQRAKQRIENSNRNIIGVVLNKRRRYIPGWLYKRL